MIAFKGNKEDKVQNTSEQARRPTVVVIIPFYNGADWVERAIKSVVTQSVQPDEFIVVNDGSKPEEREALGRLSDLYKFQIIDKPNGGQGSARNAGVRSSKSEFISLLDQDDYYFPDHIRDLLQALPKNDARLGFVYADLCAADGQGNILHSNMLRDVPGATHPKQGHIKSLLRFDLFILPSAALIKRAAFEAMGGFDEQFTGYEDDDLFLRIFRAGYTNYFLDKPVTAWCQHQGSTSWSIKMSRSRWKYFKKLVQTFPDDAFSNAYYFRECLVPRFAANFIKDATTAIKTASQDREELLGILIEFTKMVVADPGISKRYKRKLKLLTWLLSSVPQRLLLAARKLTRLRLVRKLIA
jgi:glycosyltransferase involved in cell wall biosynthesis